MMDAIRVVGLIDRTRGVTDALSTLLANVEQSLQASIRAKDLQCPIGRMFRLFSLIFALALAATACAPIPCQSGYADPNWCRDESAGGGGG